MGNPASDYYLQISLNCKESSELKVLLTSGGSSQWYFKPGSAPQETFNAVRYQFSQEMPLERKKKVYGLLGERCIIAFWNHFRAQYLTAISTLTGLDLTWLCCLAPHFLFQFLTEMMDCQTSFRGMLSSLADQKTRTLLRKQTLQLLATLAFTESFNNPLT